MRIASPNASRKEPPVSPRLRLLGALAAALALVGAASPVAHAGTYDIASAVLNDCSLPQEFRGATYDWAKGLAKTYAERAQALKNEALELTPVVRQPVKYNRAQARYSEAVDRHLRLRDEYTRSAA